MMNVDLYKKSCINKAKPKLHCNGKCQAFKKLEDKKDQDSKASTESKYNEVEVVLSSKSFFPYLSLLFKEKMNHYHRHYFSLTSTYIHSIFHPPGLHC